jgi:hypothetical protein
MSPQRPIAARTRADVLFGRKRDRVDRDDLRDVELSAIRIDPMSALRHE